MQVYRLAYMKTTLFYLIGACVLASTPARSQDALLLAPATDSYYKVYAGVSAAVQSYQLVVPMGGVRYLETVGIYPIQGVLGYQLTPRLAIQASFTKRHPANLNASESGVLANGQAYTSSDIRRQSDHAIPVLVRYRLTRRAAHKVHFDGLLGFTQQQHSYFREVRFTLDGQVASYNLENTRSSNTFLTLGMAVSYPVGQRIQVGIEAADNSNTELLRYLFRQDRPTDITPSLNAGLRYFLLPKSRA